MTFHSSQITYSLISFPLDFFYMSRVFTSVFLIRVSLSLLPLFVTQIHLPSSFHAHVIAIHPSRGCPSVVVVPFKATLQPLACTSALRCYTRPLHPQISFTLITFATLYMCRAQLCIYAIKFNYICCSRWTNFMVFTRNSNAVTRNKAGFVVDSACYLTLRNQSPFLQVFKSPFASNSDFLVNERNNQVLLSTSSRSVISLMIFHCN